MNPLQKDQTQLDVDLVSACLKDTPAVHRRGKRSNYDFAMMQFKSCSCGPVVGDLQRGRWLGLTRCPRALWEASMKQCSSPQGAGHKHNSSMV